MLKIYREFLNVFLFSLLMYSKKRTVNTNINPVLVGTRKVNLVNN
jgi:hypothetical protein